MTCQKSFDPTFEITASLAQKIRTAVEDIDVLLQSNALRIMSLEDNPNVERLPGHPQVFVVRHTQATSKPNVILDPFHYDWRNQYKLIKNLLIEKKLGQVGLAISGGTIQTVRFGPKKLANEVIEILKVITADLLGFGGVKNKNKATSSLPEISLSQRSLFEDNLTQSENIKPKKGL